MFSEGKDLSEKDVKKLKEKIKDDNYEMLVQASSDGYKVKLMGIGSDEQISKIFAQIKGENQNIYLIFSGEIYLEDLTKLDFDKIGNIGF